MTFTANSQTRPKKSIHSSDVRPINNEITEQFKQYKSYEKSPSLWMIFRRTESNYIK